MRTKISFNKPYLSGKETEYIKQAVLSGKISGDGLFTKKCQEFFEQRYHFLKTLLTTSCTDALEMAALLAEIKEGDEVIAPSYTFVSTVNAFVLRGAKIVFTDSTAQNPNMDCKSIESLITHKTRVILPVHYAGIACDMDEIMTIAKKNNLIVVEDAAQAIDSFYKDKPLGSIGELAAFSFHETKNIISGEGGMITINDEKYVKRAEIIREKGTNRSAFFRGEIDKYGWVDIGSSFLPSEIISAFLYAQIENLDAIQKRRKEIWQQYHTLLYPLVKEGKIDFPYIPDYATNNAHMFYIVCKKKGARNELIDYLRAEDITAVFHYQSLHASPYFVSKHGKGRSLPWSDYYSNNLLRLPFYYELTDAEIEFVCSNVKKYFQKN
jgi:dTDP-4-amino-4,6-dideoxygalactose transaminase